MRTSEEIYHRVRWDPRFDPARFVLGINVSAAPRRSGSRCPRSCPAATSRGTGCCSSRPTASSSGTAPPASTGSTPRRRAGSATPRLLRAPFFTARTPHAWDPARRLASRRGRPAAGAGTGRGCGVLTWNTLWDRYDSDRIDTARRRPLLLAALARADADVIALQEVERELLAPAAAASRWVRAGYTLGTDPAGRDVDDSGLLLLSRLPVREAGRHVLGPHKAVTAITVDTAAGPLVVAATHLTSDHTEDGAGTGAAPSWPGSPRAWPASTADLVLLGDFNDGGDAPARALGLRDAWTRGARRRRPDADLRPGGQPARGRLVADRPGRPAGPGPAARPGCGSTAAALLGDAPAAGRPVPVRPLRRARSTSSPARTAAAALDVRADRPHGAGLAAAAAAVAGDPGSAAAHDPQFDRWPPHVNLLFGFVPESAFERAAPLLAAAAAETAPFTARLDGRAQRSGTARRHDLARPGRRPVQAPWARLRQALAQRFPRCRGRARGTPRT